MAVELNLLPDKKRPLTPETEIRGRSLFKFSLTVLFVVVVLAASVFAFEQALLAQKRDLEHKITNLETVITGYKGREILLVLLKQKLNGIKTVLSSRPNISQEMGLIKNLLPAGSVITGFMADKTGLFTLDIFCDNSQTMDVLIRALTNNPSYDNVLISNLTGNISDGYKFIISMQAKEGSWL
jgi:hypothetical protein